MTNDSPKSRERPLLTWGLGLVAVALMAAILIPRLGGRLWWVQSLHFAQVQFAILLIVVTVTVVFLLDLILLFAGMPALAPFRGLSPVLDGAFLVAALGLGWLSYTTFREQV